MTEVDPLRALLHVQVANGGISALLLVPDPAGSTVDKAQAGEVMSRLAALLLAIESRDPNFGTSADEDGAPTDADAPDWPQAYRKVVVFLVWLLSDEQLLDKMLDGSHGDVSPLAAFMSFVGSPEEAGLTASVRVERLLLFSFVMGLMHSRLTALASIRLGASIPIRPDLVVLDMISGLTSLALSVQYDDDFNPHDAYFSAAMEMASCLSAAAAHYGRVGEEQVRARLQATADSILRLPELTGLASRAYYMLEKYGPKTVERRFEQQLSLALQSFGFLTIPSPLGTRRGDIICIVGKDRPAAVLVEAKTSARPYKLPMKDERALVDYAQRLRSSSSFLFPLRLILIVGQEPGKTLTERLKGLETDAGVSVRYCSAGALYQLLARPPTEVTAEDLVEALLGADWIVSKDHLISISSKSEENLAAWRKLINKIL